MISQFIHIYLIKLPPFVVKIKLVAKDVFLMLGILNVSTKTTANLF